MRDRRQSSWVWSVLGTSGWDAGAKLSWAIKDPAHSALLVGAAVSIVMILVSFSLFFTLNTTCWHLWC